MSRPGDEQYGLRDACVLRADGREQTDGKRPAERRDLMGGQERGQAIGEFRRRARAENQGVIDDARVLQNRNTRPDREHRERKCEPRRRPHGNAACVQRSGSHERDPERESATQGKNRHQHAAQTCRSGDEIAVREFVQRGRERSQARPERRPQRGGRTRRADGCARHRASR